LRSSKLNTSRREVFEALQVENIGVQVHYIPVHYHPYYQKLGYQRGICPAAEKLYENIITLPLFPKMTDEDIESVIQGVTKVIKFYSNA
jgi:perosamine synthetase